MDNNIKLISASAGSGKTYTLKEKLKAHICGHDGSEEVLKVRPSAIIATTFTKKAAAELKERAVFGLYEKKLFDEALEFSKSYVGTIHSVCGLILEKYCYEAGFNPNVEIITEDDQDFFLNSAFAEVITPEIREKIVQYEIMFSFNSGYNKKSSTFLSDFKKILSKVRENKLSTEALSLSMKKNEELIKKSFPLSKFDKVKSLPILVDLLKNAEDTLAAQDKLGKDDQTLLKRIGRLLRDIENEQPMIWSELLAIVNKKGNKLGASLLDGASEIAEDWLFSEEMYQDYVNYHCLMYELVAKTIEKYQKYKRDRGLVDFIDMEILVLNLLDNSSIQERIKEDFDLLLVDEFQDTSPVQLDIFLKISKLVKKSYWVGDPKQCIYGFRGADPVLMNQIVHEIEKKESVEVLSTSRRSREELVHFSNEISQKFFNNQITKERIVLKPHRKKHSDYSDPIHLVYVDKDSSVKRWSQAVVLDGVAKTVEKILQQKIMVEDRNSGERRACRPSDIAILCRSNSDCNTMASLLSTYGIASALEREGLIETPEGSLMQACLSFLLEPSNALIRAEIAVLSDTSVGVEKIIEDRINNLINDESKWLDDHPWIQKLEAIHQSIADFTIVEIIDQIQLELTLHSHVSKWGNSTQRKANLDKFRELAVKYEESQLRLKLACTLVGFLMWLPESDNAQGEGLGDNAVNVLTYHRSKGLEWPIVILSSLDSTIFDSGYGVFVRNDQGSFDFNEPLKNRLVYYFANPFGGSKNEDFEMGFKTLDIANNNRIDELSENARLMYVGYTRARDYLYLVDKIPDKERPFQWMQEIFHQFIGSEVNFPKETGIHPFSNIKLNVENILGTNNPIYKKITTDSAVTVLRDVVGKKEHEPLRVNPSSLENDHSRFTLNEMTYGNRLKVSGSFTDELLGDCFHNILANPHFNLDQIKSIIQNYGLGDQLDAEQVFKQHQEFYSYIKTQLKSTSIYNEWPIQTKLNDKIFSGIIDLWGEGALGSFVIDHKSYQGEDLKKKTSFYVGQVKLYRDLLGIDAKLYINYFSQGKLVEISL